MRSPTIYTHTLPRIFAQSLSILSTKGMQFLFPDFKYSLFHNSRRLFQQFCVDAYTMIETQRLIFIRSQQKILRVESYKTLSENAERGNTDASTTGKRVVLPSSFTGGARYMRQNYLDAMSLCKWYGHPDFFITFTCNPNWPEINRFLNESGLHSEDRPDIICRIFKMKLDHLIKYLKESCLFGRVNAVGAPVMLLRNIDQTAGLCNGTRLRVLSLGEHVIKAEIITGTNIGHVTLIPRLKLSPSDKRLPVKMNRRQFPLSVCFAMTINKSQGQSLSNVGIFLPQPVFTHGQLYVAVSRVKSRKGLKMLIYDKDGKASNNTLNVVYHEVLQKI